jgi:hypothetical protein
LNAAGGMVYGRARKNSFRPRIDSQCAVLRCVVVKLLDVIWAILRGLFRGFVEDYPFSGSEGASAHKKERPWWEKTARRPSRETKSSPAAGPVATQRAETNQASAERAGANQASTERPSMPSWWASPAPPATPPTIKVETDAGTFVAATTFSGPNLMGIRRVERPRQEGESRRRRRAPREAREASPVAHVDVELRPREPEVPQASEDATSAAVARVDDKSQPGETQATGETSRAGTEVALPIEPAEEPRVARARRVRSRLGGEGGAPRLATTLATRLALAASSSPALAAVKGGA